MKHDGPHADRLRQYMTPRWAAEELFDFFAPDAGPNDLVLEPSCGDGSILAAVPAAVPAVGIELDPALASQAYINTGREIIVGDFRTIEIPYRPTLIIGNPPYRSQLFEEFLFRCRRLLPEGGRAGFLVSTHMVQTPQVVLRWRDHWTVDHRVVPRTLFPRAVRPLSFLTFTKGGSVRRLRGFLLYDQARDVAEMTRRPRVLLTIGRVDSGSRPCWRDVVGYALIELGGQGTLDEIYRVVSPRRPSSNRWWQEKVRQVCRQSYWRVGRGTYALPAVA